MAAAKATPRMVREPWIMRESTSRLRLSVPMGCSRLGAASLGARFLVQRVVARQGGGEGGHVDGEQDHGGAGDQDPPFQAVFPASSAEAPQKAGHGAGPREAGSTSFRFNPGIPHRSP